MINAAAIATMTAAIAMLSHGTSRPDCDDISRAAAPCASGGDVGVIDDEDDTGGEIISAPVENPGGMGGGGVMSSGIGTPSGVDGRLSKLESVRRTSASVGRSSGAFAIIWNSSLSSTAEIPGLIEL